MRSHWIKVGWKPSALCLYKKSVQRHRDTEGRMHMVKSRVWSGLSADLRTPGMVGSHQTWGRDKKGVFAWSLQGTPSWHLDSGLPFQNCKGIHFCFSKPPSLWWFVTTVQIISCLLIKQKWSPLGSSKVCLIFLHFVFKSKKPSVINLFMWKCLFIELRIPRNCSSHWRSLLPAHLNHPSQGKQSQSSKT